MKLKLVAAHQFKIELFISIYVHELTQVSTTYVFQVFTDVSSSVQLCFKLLFFNEILPKSEK